MLLVRNLNRNILLAYKAGIANTSQKRRIGLLGHDCFNPGDGLWIVPCEGVHTFGMKFPIDVVYLNRSKKVLKVKAGMPRSRMSLCLRAHSVLELPAGIVDATGTVVGDQLEFERIGDAA